jgi:hypothetical protein
MSQERMEAYYQRMEDPARCIAYLEALQSKDPARIQAEESALHFSDYLTVREFLAEVRR